MTKYTLSPSESKKHNCELCGKPAQFAIIRNSGATTFGCSKCMR